MGRSVLLLPLAWTLAGLFRNPSVDAAVQTEGGQSHMLTAAIGNLSSRPSCRIVGGHPTSITNYSYLISLQYKGSHICGGSIISTEWVLTAAHCMVYPASGYTVRAGTSTPNSGGTVYNVSSVISHPSYNTSNYDYDIAVIRISGHFNLSSAVQVVRLATSEPASNASAVVAGWGTTTEGGSSANTLQYVTVPIVSNSDCIAAYNRTASITDRMLCAGCSAGGKDACQGDSGGPLVSGGVQVGVVSWGLGCGRPKYPGVYSNVANLRSWVCSTTAVEATCGSCVFKSELGLLFLTVLFVLHFYL